jgi:hypothetical protein
MGYKIQGKGPEVLGGTITLFSGTATDALKKLETIKNRCRCNGSVVIYDNAIVISEDELNLNAKGESDYQTNPLIG